MYFTKLNKLGQSGVSHILAPLLVIVLVATIGVFMLVASHADALKNKSDLTIYSAKGTYKYVRISSPSSTFTKAKCQNKRLHGDTKLTIKLTTKTNAKGDYFPTKILCNTPTKDTDIYSIEFFTSDQKPDGNAVPVAAALPVNFAGDSCVFVHVDSFRIHNQGTKCVHVDTSTDAGQPGTVVSTPKPKKPKKPTKPHKQAAVYVNPFKKVMENGGFEAFRIDEGVDYKGHGPVYAIGDAEVIIATSNSTFWAHEGGENTVYKLKNGKAKGLSVFVAESCTPKVHRHQKIKAGDEVCYMHGDKYPFIETGWWDNKTATPKAWGVYHEGDETAYGLNFSQLLKSLGVPGGNTNQAHVSNNQGHIVGKLPPDWPRWD